MKNLNFILLFLLAACNKQQIPQQEVSYEERSCIALEKDLRYQEKILLGLHERQKAKPSPADVLAFGLTLGVSAIENGVSHEGRKSDIKLTEDRILGIKKIYKEKNCVEK